MSKVVLKGGQVNTVVPGSEHSGKVAIKGEMVNTMASESEHIVTGTQVYGHGQSKSQLLVLLGENSRLLIEILKVTF
ncbi:hypothetical protein DPMN_114860 [Dreissena polymorpha]|uniref:Uncharacterized protein n=1 Tax=Dreissena polymorpha TaxID=45954 RepID=A0A9D4KKW2_DREPO|nr:hypothetical protein DPMN_114860 [Dreissena polymorpha]